ncbi:MAG: dicarboxylate/amino acid:cation symporter [Micrococcales bacterium]
MDWNSTAVLAAVILGFAGLYLLRRRKINFSLVTFIALVVGVPLGFFAQGHADFVEPFGKIYINLLLASVAPLIVLSIVSSITSLNSLSQLKSIGVRSIAWLLGSNGLAVILALGLGLFFEIGKGVNESLGGQELSVLQNSVQNFGDVFVNFFPSNLITDISGNHVIPLIIVAVTISVAYLALNERRSKEVKGFRENVESLRLVVFKAVSYVIRLTPYAVLTLTVEVVANTKNLKPQFFSLIGLLALTWLACAIHTFAINGVLLRVFAKVSPLAFFKKILPAQLTAFTTQSSLGTLPVTTNALTKKVGVHPEIANFTAPLGTAIGMPGCAGIWPILISVWGINAYGIQYSLGQYALLAVLGTLVSVGTAGVPGAATVSSATVLAAAGLPLEFIAVTLPISLIADMARTATNVTAAAVSATVVARQVDLLDDEIFNSNSTEEEVEIVKA